MYHRLISYSEQPCSAIINDLNTNYNKLPSNKPVNNNNNKVAIQIDDDDDKPMFAKVQTIKPQPAIQTKKRTYSAIQPKNVDKQENNVFVHNEKHYSNNENNNNNSMDETLKEINEKKQKLGILRKIWYCISHVQTVEYLA